MSTLPATTSDYRHPGRSYTGQQIGEYILGELIGVGGIGQVYEARQPIIDKRVAVKLLATERCTDSDQVARFIAEARAVNAIRHRNIVDVFSFGELPDGTPYLVMEFLEGKPLDQVISERAPVPPATALQWVEGVLEALAAAHEAGIVHRDVKPSNVFLVQPRRGRSYVKLLDFGAAKLGAAPRGLTRPTPASQVIGTPTYMAPEQALGLPIGPSSDLYAVGGLLFELLTGRVVFPALTPFESMRRHAQEQAPHPSELVPSLPRGLDELVSSLLRKEPAERPQSADAVRKQCEALRLVVGALDSPAAPTSPAELPALRVETLDAPVQPLVAAPPVVEVAAGPRAAAPGSRRPAFVLAVSVALMLTAGIAGLSSRDRPPPGQVPQVIVPPPPAPAPAPVLEVAPVSAAPEDEKLEPLPPAPVVRATPRARVHAPPARAADAPLTDEVLLTRKAELEARLASREQIAGEPDRVVRRLLAGIDLGGARDETERRAAWNRLEEVGRQLDGR